MMKPRAASPFFVYAGLFLAFNLGRAAGLSAAGTPPPPPFVNPDAYPSASGTPAPVTPSATATPAAGASGQALAPDLGSSSVAAPTISDDQQIQNSMDMALDLFHAEDYQACARATAGILERYPKKKLYWVLYLQGLSQEHQDRYPDALVCYQKVLKEAPHTTYADAAAFRIGLCQLKQGDSGEAMYTLRDIIENNPHSGYRLQAYVHLGNLYRTQHEWHEAERVYRDLIRFYPNSSWAWVSEIYLAETHAHRGDDTGAIRVYARLLDDVRAPETLRAQAELRMGDLYISDGRWLEALQVYRYCLRDFSDVPGVPTTCDEKIKIATEGRRYNRVPYHPVDTGPRVVTEAPADENYLLNQEKVPDQ